MYHANYKDLDTIHKAAMLQALPKWQDGAEIPVLNHIPENLLSKAKAQQIQELIQILNGSDNNIPEKNIPAQVIQQARQMSAGDVLNFTTSQVNGKNLASVFAQLSKEKPDNDSPTFPLKSLIIDQSHQFDQSSYFPTDQSQKPNEEALKSIYKSFLVDQDHIPPTDDLQSYLTTLLSILEKHWVFAPTPVTNQEEVSLFDYSKSVTALALCIYKYLWAKNNGEIEKASLDNQEKPFLMIGADLSGIQGFIYDIIGAKASKNLKGRSFYLQLLVQNILAKLLDDLNLSPIQIIYSSGGGFFVLAPNTGEVKEAFQEFTKEVTRQLFDAHKNNLFLALTYLELGKQEVYGETLSERWRSLTEKLNQEKRKRLNTLLVDEYDQFFNPIEVGGTQARDEITNEEFAKGEKREVFERNEKNEPLSYVKKTTLSQVNLGEELRNADFIISSNVSQSFGKNVKEYHPSELNIYNYLLSKKSPKTTLEDIHLQKLNQSDFLSNPPSADQQSSYGFMFYGGNAYPKTLTEDGKERPKFFDELAGASHESFRRLGVLRMDVDNLASIFKQGFAPEKRTFARYSTLSRNMDYFFKGYLNTIWQSDERFKEYTYIIYAGGDDLFILGKWNYLIDFAEEIKNSFKAWTCHNPHLSLSGGMAIVPPKFPIAKAAKFAEEAEKAAKGHSFKGQEKNAFAILGKPLHWDAEFPVVKYLKNQLVDLIQHNNQLPKGFLQRITGFQEQADLQKRKNLNEAWRWRIAYDMAQVTRRIRKGNKAAKDFVQKISCAVFTDRYQLSEGLKYVKDKYTFLEILSLAARWAELEIRTNK